MPKNSLNVSLKGADDIFSTEESRQEQQREQVQQIPIGELFPFKHHPFKVLDDESMQRTVESVEQYGVLSPLIARPRPEGGYEIISGHRRQHAAQLAGLETLPVIVRQMDDDGKSKRLRYLAQSKEPVYPISYIRCKKPMDLKRNVCAYTPQGRSEIHNDLQMDTTLLLQLMKATAYSRSAEYMDNRISLFSAQQGKCAVTGKTFESVSDIHCHHKRPKSLGGTDCYGNLVLVLAPVHELIHATNKSAIDSRLSVLKLNRQQLAKLNRLRISAEVKPIDSEEIALELNSHNGMTKEIKKTV